MPDLPFKARHIREYHAANMSFNIYYLDELSSEKVSFSYIIIASIYEYYKYIIPNIIYDLNQKEKGCFQPSSFGGELF